jgi:hypothetical protein
MTTCEKTRTQIDTGAGPQGLAGSERRHLQAHVQGHLDECGACRAYAAETDSLLSLLAGTPRVEAPPDFDFRLRARIATVKGQRSSIWTSLAALWSRPMGSVGSMSWTRAAAPLAAVALVAGTAALYATRSTAPVPDAIASRVSPPAVQPAASQTPSLPLVSAAPLAAPAPPAMERALSANPRVTNASRVSRQPVTGVARELPSSQLDPDFSAMQGTRVVVEARGARPMVTIPQVTYGAQRAVMRQSAPAGDVAAIQTVF